MATSLGPATISPSESDWRRAKERFQEILDATAREVAAQAAAELRRGSRKFLISYRHFSPRVYTSVQDSGVLLTLRFLAPVRARRGLAEQLWEAILDALHDESGIDLAYQIGAHNAWAFDIHMRCATTVSALKVARSLMSAPWANQPRLII